MTFYIHRDKARDPLTLKGHCSKFVSLCKNSGFLQPDTTARVFCGRFGNPYFSEKSVVKYNLPHDFPNERPSANFLLLLRVVRNLHTSIRARLLVSLFSLCNRGCSPSPTALRGCSPSPTVMSAQIEAEDLEELLGDVAMELDFHKSAGQLMRRPASHEESWGGYQNEHRLRQRSLRLGLFVPQQLLALPQPAALLRRSVSEGCLACNKRDMLSPRWNRPHLALGSHWTLMPCSLRSTEFWGPLPLPRSVSTSPYPCIPVLPLNRFSPYPCIPILPLTRFCRLLQSVKTEKRSGFLRSRSHGSPGPGAPFRALSRNRMYQENIAYEQLTLLSSSGSVSRSTTKKSDSPFRYARAVSATDHGSTCSTYVSFSTTQLCGLQLAPLSLHLYPATLACKFLLFFLFYFILSGAHGCHAMKWAFLSAQKSSGFATHAGDWLRAALRAHQPQPPDPRPAHQPRP